MGWTINRRKVKGYKDIVASERYIYIEYESINGSGRFIFKEMYMTLHKKLFEKKFKDVVVTKWALLTYKNNKVYVVHGEGYMGLGRFTL